MASPPSYSVNSSDYKLLEEIGYGASAIVFRAIFIPSNEVVAVKSLDLDRCNINLDDVRKEAQTMILIDHPNVIKAYCSFVVDRRLWVVMPFMSEGSCLHLMKIAYPDGFEENAIGSILKETLKALDYLHRQGHIHRDVKAGNILLDNSGTVKLADFGVSACMFDSGDRQRARNTFVGTPCWMAPEVLQPGSGYNYKADIWSFGITALELAHGHAPFSKYPPMKVLLMTIQNAPPGLDYERDKKFSKSFKEMVAMCLVKDPTKRPSADKLLKHSFFKHTKPPEVCVKKLSADLPPLWNRVKTIQLNDDAQIAMKQMPSAEEEAMSQSEYQRGVSAWNFDLEDLKAQAAVATDYDDITETRVEDESIQMKNNAANVHETSLGKASSTNAISKAEPNVNSSVVDVPQANYSNRKGKGLATDSLGPKSEDKDGWKPGPNSELNVLTSENPLTTKGRKTQSGPLVPGLVFSHSRAAESVLVVRPDTEIQPASDKARRSPNLSGPLMLPNRASANSLSAPIKSSGGFRDSLDDKSKTNLVQIRGRFSVTSENLDLEKDVPLNSVSRRSSQISPLRKSASVDRILDTKPVPPNLHLKDVGNVNVPASVLVPRLHDLFQQSSLQHDMIMKLLYSLQLAEAADAAPDGKLPTLPENNGRDEPEATERERQLLIKISELQARMADLTDELMNEKLKHIQLQQQLNSKSSHKSNGSNIGG
ncbi:hypothetical protein ACFE04_005214 [Oxalis oulophora]